MSRYSRILVTGGAGFIGSHIVDRLLKQGFEVKVIDNFSTGNMQNINEALNNKNFHLVKGDIRDPVLVKQAMAGADAVFHEAAEISIAKSIEDPLLTTAVNIMGTLNLTKAAVDSGVKRFIFASSAAVYGESSEHLKTELMPTNPTSPYGVTKLAVEKFLKTFYESNGLEAVSLRYFNVYGSRQRSDITGQYGGVITIFTNRLLNNLSPLIYGNGTQTRDFVYVKDVVEANICALHCAKANGEVFNVGSGSKTSVNDVSEQLKIILGKHNISNVYEKSRIGDVQHSCADISKAIANLNWSPQYTFMEGVKDSLVQTPLS